MSRTSYVAASLALVAGMASLSFIALADGLRTPPVSDPIVAKECSACHMLYPAGLLPARSWAKLSAGLKDHFGDNAELDVDTTKKVQDYLTANAADKAGRTPKVLRDLAKTAEPIRITELPWWKRKHERKDRTSPATLAKKGAKFKGDCAACHKEAAKGFFDED